MNLEQREEATLTERLLAAVDDVMDVHAYRVPLGNPAADGRIAGNVSLEVEGRLRAPAALTYPRVAERFRALGHMALFRRAAHGQLILALAGAPPAGGSNARLAAAMFTLTLLSVLAVGGLAETPEGGLTVDVLAGLPFAASLLGILLAHEMGHYLVARRLGVPASLPFFIPMPLSIFGTMGAVMQIKAPPRDRRALLALGAAGPVAGLVVAVPVLLLGLALSEVRPMVSGPGGFQEGNSLLYAGLKFLVFGRLLPGGGEDVFLHPVALAGWAGLLVTALNLLPAGQLDGGHVAYALLGERARLVTGLVIVVLALLGLLWWGWFLWAGFAWAFARVHAVPFDDVTDLSPRQRLLGLALFVVGLLVFVPVPMQPL